MQQDPLEDFFPGESPYGYAYHNPVMFNDPTGLAPEKEKGAKGDKLATPLDVNLGHGETIKNIIYDYNNGCTYVIIQFAGNASPLGPEVGFRMETIAFGGGGGMNSNFGSETGSEGSPSPSMGESSDMPHKMKGTGGAGAGGNGLTPEEERLRAAAVQPTDGSAPERKASKSYNSSPVNNTDGSTPDGFEFGDAYKGDFLHFNPTIDILFKNRMNEIYNLFKKIAPRVADYMKKDLQFALFKDVLVNKGVNKGRQVLGLSYGDGKIGLDFNTLMGNLNLAAGVLLHEIVHDMGYEEFFAWSVMVSTGLMSFNNAFALPYKYDREVFNEYFLYGVPSFLKNGFMKSGSADLMKLEMTVNRIGFYLTH